MGWEVEREGEAVVGPWGYGLRERGWEECAGIDEAGEERGRGRGEISSRGVVGRDGA